MAVAIAAVIAAAPSAHAAAPACVVLPDIAKLDHALSRTAARIAAGEPVKIVALGSSSTAGTGASSPAATYPSRLAVELKRLWPDVTVTVLNRGVGGEEARDMLKRIDVSVFAEAPDLVLWQVGTNAVLRDAPLPPAERQIDEGLRRIKARGIDVVLMDPQYSPRVVARPETMTMVALLAQAAKEYNVDIFHRFALMRRWVRDQGIPFVQFVSPDRLHMNDWSYACVAKLLAVAIAGAVERPMVSVSSRHPGAAAGRILP